jgi:hypothetical protein
MSYYRGLARDTVDEFCLWSSLDAHLQARFPHYQRDVGTRVFVAALLAIDRLEIMRIM